MAEGLLTIMCKAVGSVPSTGGIREDRGQMEKDILLLWLWFVVVGGWGEQVFVLRQSLMM